MNNRIQGVLRGESPPLILTREGIAIPPGVFSTLEICKLKKKCIVSSKGFKDRIITMQAFHVDRSTRTLYLARMRGIVELGKLGYSVVCNIPEGEELSSDISLAPIILKDFQEPIYKFLSEVAFSDSAFQLGMTSCILDMKPGLGKTFIAMALIQYISKKTLFIIPGKDLQNQTVALLKTSFPMLKIGTYSSTERTDGDIVVMTAASASAGDTYVFSIPGQRKKQTMDFKTYFDRFGFTIIDEIHQYCTSERKALFTRCQSLFTIGMSGTCNHRADKMDLISHHHIGVPIVAAKFIEKFEKDQIITPPPLWKLKAYCIKYNGPDIHTQPLTSSEGTISHPKMITQFSKDPYRSQLLVNIIKQTINEGHQIFVLLDRTELVRLAWDYLKTTLDENDLLVAPELQNATMVTGGVKDAQRSIARKSKVVVGTYACLGTGISWSEFSAIIFWHSRRNNFEQFLNRIFRDGGNREIERKAYFLQDNCTSLKSQYYGFRKVCIKERNVTPEIVTYDWQDIEVKPELKKIAEDFAKWDDIKQAERLAKFKLNNI